MEKPLGELSRHGGVQTGIERDRFLNSDQIADPDWVFYGQQFAEYCNINTEFMKKN